MPANYKGVVTIPQSQGYDPVFAHAGITVSNSSAVTCRASLTFDNAVDCTYFVDEPITDDQMFLITNASGVLAATRPSNVTMHSALRDALRFAIASAIGAPLNRFLLAGFNETTGLVDVYMLPDTGSQPVAQQWEGTLNVCGLSSISVANASSILFDCGVNPTDVAVENGTHVTFYSRNNSDAVTACLNAHAHVCNASLTPFGWLGSSLSPSELADALIGTIDDNQFSLLIGNRLFWAIPGQALEFNAPPSTGRSSSDSGGSSMIYIAAAAGGGVLCLVALVAVLAYRRHVRKNPAPAPATSTRESMGMRRPSNVFNRGRERTQSSGTTNPLFVDTLDEPALNYLDAQNENGYQEFAPFEKHEPFQFDNPLYHAPPVGEVTYDQSSAGPLYDTAKGATEGVAPYSTITNAPKEIQFAAGYAAGFAAAVDRRSMYGEAAPPRNVVANAEYLGVEDVLPGQVPVAKDDGYMFIDPSNEAPSRGELEAPSRGELEAYGFGGQEGAYETLPGELDLAAPE